MLGQSSHKTHQVSPNGSVTGDKNCNQSTQRLKIGSSGVIAPFEHKHPFERFASSIIPLHQESHYFTTSSIKFSRALSKVCFWCWATQNHLGQPEVNFFFLRASPHLIIVCCLPPDTQIASNQAFHKIAWLTAIRIVFSSNSHLLPLLPWCCLVWLLYNYNMDR